MARRLLLALSLLCILSVKATSIPGDVVPETRGVAALMDVIAADATVSLLAPEVSEMANIVDQWVTTIRRGCTIPDGNALNYPVTEVTKDGATYQVTFGSPQKSSDVAYTAVVVAHQGDFIVKSTTPRPCRIGRVTEDSPELEDTITPHQKAIADTLVGKINALRKACSVSAIDMTKSKILAVAEQIVAGTEYTFRLQLQDAAGLTDVAVIDATMPPGKMAAGDVHMRTVRPDSCELFPKTETPVEDPNAKQSLAQEEAARIELINSQRLSWSAGKHATFD